MAGNDNPQLVELTAEIVSAYVCNNNIDRGELATLIGDVHAALSRRLASKSQPEAEPQKPAVPIRRSVTPDYIVCLEDGQQFKSLKRHLKAAHDLTPDEYRAKWNLRPDYPLTAPNYSEARSAQARKIGLGGRRAKAEPRPAKRGRSKSA